VCGPYTLLEPAGRNIYVGEGCCTWPQMIRPLRDEVKRSARVATKYSDGCE